jgi:hypothetical protein
MVLCAEFGKWIDWHVDVWMYTAYGVRSSEITFTVRYGVLCNIW